MDVTKLYTAETRTVNNNLRNRLAATMGSAKKSRRENKEIGDKESCRNEVRSPREN